MRKECGLDCNPQGMGFVFQSTVVLLLPAGTIAQARWYASVQIDCRRPAPYRVLRSPPTPEGQTMRTCCANLHAGALRSIAYIRQPLPSGHPWSTASLEGVQFAKPRVAHHLSIVVIGEMHFQHIAPAHVQHERPASPAILRVACSRCQRKAGGCE